MCATSLLIVLLVGHVLPVSSSTPETRQDDVSGNMLPCTARSHGERLPCLATQIRLSLAMELKGFGAEITVVENSQLQQVLDALSSAQQLVKGILRRLPAAAHHHPLVRSASRQMLQTDPCAACVPAAPCYSLACKDGKMDTDGPFKACADAQGVCNACYPNSACGSLPTGSTPGTATGHGGSEPESTRQDVAPDRVDGQSKGSDTGARHTANAARDFDFENMHSKADTLSTGYGLCLDISGSLYSAQGDTERAEFYTMIGEITRFQASFLDHIPLSATQHTGFRPLCRQMLPMLCLIWLGS